MDFPDFELDLRHSHTGERSMYLRSLTLLLVLIICSARTTASREIETPVQDVTYEQFASDPSHYSGMRIRIRAILVYGFELSKLTSPIRCREGNLAVWVEFDEDMKGNSKKLFKRFPEGMGYVLGVFVGKVETGKAYGTGQRVQFTIDQIEKVEAQRSPKYQKPSWLPPECLRLPPATDPGGSHRGV
jgi:hypothetical protein